MVFVFKLGIAIWLVILGAISMVFAAIINGATPIFAFPIIWRDVIYGASFSTFGFFGGIGLGKIAIGASRNEGVGPIIIV